MSCFRALLLWALILAVPFQGYAAASMAFCEFEHSEAATVTQADPHRHSNTVMPHTARFSVLDDDAAAHHDDDSGSAHKCGTCAACHAVALILDTSIVRSQYLPAADLAEPRTLSTTLFPPLLERPPRV